MLSIKTHVRMKRLFWILFILGIGFLVLSVRDTPTSKSHKMEKENEEIRNVLGGVLQTCCVEPMTGFYRNGRCDTGPDDYGTHVVCAEMTREFLDYTKNKGNDLCTARPEYHFPGLKPGDKWCLCAVRWQEAYEAGFAPPVILERTHEKALQYIRLSALKSKVLRKI